MKYQLIIFDCDGTLVDSESLTNKVIAGLLTEMDIPTSPQESYELFAGKKMRDIEEYILDHKGGLAQDGFEPEFRKRCAVIFDNELEAIPGVIDLIEQTTAHMCIASNGPQKKMKLTLAITDLAKYFPEERIFSAYDISKWKPDPGLFLHAADKMQTHPSKCVVIEDSVSGILGALNADMDVVAYNPKQRADILSLNVPSFTTMQEIYQFVNR